MRGRWLVNLLLLAIAVLLGLAIQRDLARERTPPTLSGIDPADLRMVEVTRDGELPILIEREPSGWQIRTPLQADADPEHLKKLLAILDTPVHRSFPAQSAALDQLGLAAPKLRLRLDALTLEFGDLDPISQFRYVASERLVHLIDDRFQHLLIAPPIDYVSKALLPRGFTPVFGTLDGVPLAAQSLEALAGVIAERVEPLGGELSGTIVEVKREDGSAVRYLASADRRRWSRLDRKLLYVLSEAPRLVEDPSAIDPTPPPPEPTLDSLPDSGAADSGVFSGAPPEEIPGTTLPEPFAPTGDPGAPLPGDAVLGAPPAVRLSPEDQSEPGIGFGAEPYKEPPQGFGMDPFAPDPAPDPGPVGR